MNKKFGQRFIKLRVKSYPTKPEAAKKFAKTTFGVFVSCQSHLTDFKKHYLRIPTRWKIFIIIIFGSGLDQPTEVRFHFLTPFLESLEQAASS